MTDDAQPLLGREEPTMGIPVWFLGTAFVIEHPDGFLTLPARCWWEPIEDEE